MTSFCLHTHSEHKRPAAEGTRELVLASSVEDTQPLRAARVRTVDVDDLAQRGRRLTSEPGQKRAIVRVSPSARRGGHVRRTASREATHPAGTAGESCAPAGRPSSLWSRAAASSRSSTCSCAGSSAGVARERARRADQARTHAPRRAPGRARRHRLDRREQSVRAVP
jgi:hypothetical protein